MFSDDRSLVAYQASLSAQLLFRLPGFCCASAELPKSIGDQQYSLPTSAVYQFRFIFATAVLALLVGIEMAQDFRPFLRQTSDAWVASCSPAIIRKKEKNRSSFLPSQPHPHDGRSARASPKAPVAICYFRRNSASRHRKDVTSLFISLDYGRILRELLPPHSI